MIPRLADPEGCSGALRGPAGKDRLEPSIPESGPCRNVGERREIDQRGSYGGMWSNQRAGYVRRLVRSSEVRDHFGRR